MNCLEWKKFNEFIEVSNDGQIKSHGKLVKGERPVDGYIRVHVSHNGRQYRYSVHRLVATMFIPNPENKPCVNHIDGNKHNNCVSNLEWCTHGENLKHAFKSKLRDCRGSNNPRAKFSKEEIEKIRKSYIKGKHCEFNSRGLAKKYNTTPDVILNIVTRKTYAEEGDQNR